MISETVVELNSTNDYFVFFAIFIVLALVYIFIYLKKVFHDC